LGGIDDAISLARRRAHIPASEDVVVEVLPRSKPAFFRDALAGLWDQGDYDDRLFAHVPEGARAWLAAAELPPGSVLALMPFLIDVR
jgi:hypothetical protein